MDRRKICRYFERGSCKKQKCPFVHLRETRKNCQFYLQGFCKKGDNCNFYHPPKQSQTQKNARKNYKPTLEKKQKHKHRQQDQQHNNQQQHEHETQQKIVEKQQQHQQQKNQPKIQNQKEEEIQQKQQNHLDNQTKQKQINFLLGLEGEQSSSQDGEQLQKRIEALHTQTQQNKKRKPLNFVKTYPKKFPDYTKSAQSKLKIAQNQKKYFNGVKFPQFISKIQDETQKQYYQIIRKFQDSFTIFQQEETEKNEKIFNINLRPILFEPEILLHFEMIEDSIQLKIDARQYPKERAKFQILNVSIPEQYKQKLVQFLQKIHSKKSIFQTLKIFMNTFEKNYQQIKSKLQDQYYSRIQLQDKINKKLSQQMQKNEKKKEKKQRKVDKQKIQSQNPDLAIIKYEPGEKINVGNMTYEIKLQSLLIQNAEYVLAQRFLLFLECRCEKKLVHILEADRKEMKVGVKLKCKKCQMIIPIAIQRQVMQLRSQTIGMLGIQNGRLLQVGGVSWKIGCTCDAQIVKPRICLPGYRLGANCQLCFRSMQVSYMGLKIHNPFFRQNQQIQDGKQLPGKGACKHMKLSFRWIRYGCCGRTFSCDDCHVNGSVYPHQKIQGITMLCGFCSIEQPVNKECSHCRKQLVKGVDKSGHWQGGMGCRDKNLLSRKDAKKYAGLTKHQNKQQNK